MASPESGDWNKFWQTQDKDKILNPSWSKKRIIEILKPYVLSGKKVLDAGCGSGFFSKYFCDEGLSVTALDYSDDALKMTRELTGGRAKIIKADLTSAQLSGTLDGAFDIIFSDGLLEHFDISRQQAIVRNFRAHLAPAGVVITFVPNRFSPWELIRPFFMPGIEETPFVLSGLTFLQRQCGLKMIRSGGVNTLPFLFSPDKIFGKYFGMLLYTVACKNE